MAYYSNDLMIFCLVKNFGASMTVFVYILGYIKSGCYEKDEQNRIKKNCSKETGIKVITNSMRLFLVISKISTIIDTHVHKNPRSRVKTHTNECHWYQFPNHKVLYY